MPPSDFAKADIPSIVEQLSAEEAISLLAGVGNWHTAAIPRLGVPAAKVLLISNRRTYSDNSVNRSAMDPMVRHTARYMRSTCDFLSLIEHM